MDLKGKILAKAYYRAYFIHALKGVAIANYERCTYFAA
jgi:hypothetical protein